MLTVERKNIEKAPSWSQAMAKKLVLNRLTQLNKRSLRIEEPDGNVECIGDQNDSLAVIQMNSWDTYSMMMSGGALGAAEAYMENAWNSPDLVEVVRFFAANIGQMGEFEKGVAALGKPALKLLHAHNRNSMRGSRRNISAHYDLGNDFFSLFLDRTMMYSSAVFESDDMTLEQASAHKLDMICKKLALEPGMTVLEIGTGWGGFALHAARNYGVTVTTTTISREQARYAREQVTAARLDHKITILEKDYRELTGKYDRVVSIEMIEAVGAEYLDSYFSVLGERLKSDGKMLLQAITVPDQRYDFARRQVDFIKRYIFPGGFLPSVEVMSRHIRRDTSLVVTDIQDIGQHYALTIDHWRRHFKAALPDIEKLGFDERFIRMWDYYFCYCQGAFQERAISTVHLVAVGPDHRPALY